MGMASNDSATVVRAAHSDRLARAGVDWLKRLFAVYGVKVDTLHPKKLDGRDEPLEDFVSLVTTFAGRLYKMRSAKNRRRLLAKSDQCGNEGHIR